MKSHFSPHWKASKRPSKQRKYLRNAPLHTKHRFLSSSLSKSLRQKHAKRSLPLRKGDEVLVMRGSFKKKKAKIASLNYKNCKVFLEGLQRTKKDGSKVNVPFHPSNLQITLLNTDDKMRLASSKPKATTSQKTSPKTQPPVKSKE